MHCFPLETFSRIFGEISVDDRLSCRRVCRLWKANLHCAQLWSGLVLHLKPPVNKVYRVVALEYGAYVKNLHLVCDQKDEKCRQKTLLFLDLLHQQPTLKLESFKLDFCQENPLFFRANDFSCALNKLFSGRKVSLKKVDLSGFPATINDDLVKTLTTYHATTLHTLDVQNKILSSCITAQSISALIKISQNLRELYVQASSFSEEALTLLPRLPLEVLSLQYTRPDKNTRVVSEDVWAQVTDKLPNMKVRLSFDHTFPVEYLIHRLQVAIPVSSLELQGQTALDTHIEHVTSTYSETLESFTLCALPSAGLGTSLVRMARQCTKLQELHVWCRMDEQVVEEILHWRALNKYTLVYGDKVS